tara:strand:+ start:4113 stop:4712 length:600 start_codon:yes stop_codon:yes gene_type:complete
MKIIAGLGNPGSKYETTRHNAGFLLVDRLIDRWNATGPTLKNQGEIYQATYGSEKILLVKPQTYMNESGRCIGPLFQFYKLNPPDLIVAHDEVDLSPITLRIKTGGGTGGHNGLKSVDRHVGTDNKDYHRVRIGVGKSKQVPTEVHVLKPFSNEELRAIDSLLDDAARAIELLVENKPKEAMNQYNQKIEYLKGNSHGI